MNVKYDMVIDFARPYKNHTILCSQNDHLSRVPHFVLRSNGKALDVSDVETYTVTAVKSDGSTSSESGTLDTDEDGNAINELTYTIPQDLTSSIGTCTCTITLNGTDGSVLQSFEFYIKNRNVLYKEDDSDSDDLSGFRDVLNRATEAIKKIEDLSSKSKLPNPYPLRFVIGTQTTTYDGSETVTVRLTSVAYLSEDMIKTAPVTWTS